MKFCFVDRISGYSIWGVLAPIASTLLRMGHSVDFVRMVDGNSNHGLTAPKGVRVVDVKVPSKNFFFDLVGQQARFANDFAVYLAAEKPDLVHANFAVPSIVSRWMAARMKVPHIVSTQHELYGSMRFHLRWGLRLTEKCCSAVVYVSEAVARSFGRNATRVGQADIGERPTQVVIPNGVDVRMIRSAVRGVKRIPGKIVCAGRMVPEKGQALLLRAFERIVGDHPQARLLLVGSGPSEERLKAFVRASDLEGKVRFTGWVSYQRILREMASAELVVVPSDGKQEGFGLVCAEALICGTPLLVSDIPVFREWLDRYPKRVGYFSRGNVDSLVEGLRVHFSRGVGKGNMPGVLNKKDESSLSSETMAKAYLELYGRLLGWDRKDRSMAKASKRSVLN